MTFMQKTVFFSQRGRTNRIYLELKTVSNQSLTNNNGTGEECPQRIESFETCLESHDLSQRCKETQNPEGVWY